MATTTQILFNSPALHSLKRDQLVKLCKIHSIKASGKNTELIEKLKQHAQTLPRDSPLSVAARSEGSDVVNEGEKEHDGAVTGAGETNDRDSDWHARVPRPSEQWEVVMESIEETMEDSSSQGTLSSMRTLNNNNGGSGEFGTGTSKSSSVGSSIKALATSLGLKRHNTSKSTIGSFPTSSSSKSTLYHSSTSDDLTQHSKPYATLPDTDIPPQSDHLTFDPSTSGKNEPPPTPLPGQSLRPGAPAPVNARLSLGLGLGAPSTPTRVQQPTTTIRLISNGQPSNDTETNFIGRTPQLKPFKTSFDLVMSPSSGFDFGGAPLWPHEDIEYGGLYPPLPLDDLNPPPAHKGANNEAFLPTSLSYVLPRTPAPARQLDVPVAKVEPFVFGSPLPQHNVTNAQFKSAAASVLEEMNRRLKEEGVESVGMDLIGKLEPGAHAGGVDMLVDRTIKPLPKTHGVKEKFEKLHDAEFQKMEGIDGVAKRKGMPLRKDVGDGRVCVDGIGKKRKSSVLGHGVGRDRYGRRIGSNTGRISQTRVISGGRRSRILPGSFDDDDEDSDEREGTNDAGEGSQKRVRVEAPVSEFSRVTEMDEEKKRKEKEAIRRKLEMNKARRRSSASVATRGRVSVGRGGVPLKPQPKPSRFGFLSSAKSLVQNVFNRGKSSGAAAATTGAPTNIPKPVVKMAPPTQPPPTKKASSTTATPALVGNGGKMASLRLAKETDKSAIVTSSRARSPLPSFGPVSSTSGSFMNGTRSSRISFIGGTGPFSKTGGASKISSIGTRSSFSTTTNLSSGVGSMGAKKAPNLAGNMTSSSSKISSNSRLSSSRLLAPTASSLAKATRPSSSWGGLKPVAESSLSKADTSNMIANNPSTSKGLWSPRPGKIFSRPLEGPSRIPTPVKDKRIKPVSNAQEPISLETGTIKDMELSAIVPRQRSLNGRKPRISRSRVIAKLASQRAASGGSGGDVSGTPSRPGRTRSSLGAKAQRASFGGKSNGMRGAHGGDVLMSAKKRARQSEYGRRRSRVGPMSHSKDLDSMDVDAE